MELRFLGGAREVGRSAILVNDRLLLDYGMKPGTPPQFPVGSVEPEAVVVSHGHLDHAGAVPGLLSGDRRPPVHWTPPTRELTEVLARDTLGLRGGSYDCPFTAAELARLPEVSVPHGYREPFEAAGHEVRFFDAGHIPGSAHVLVDDGETRLFYTADFHTEAQRIVDATTARPAADVVLCESTYSETTREPRERTEEAFADSVERTLWEGGTVVVPAFAVGRTQEMLLVCLAHDIDCYVDGMGTEVTELLLGYPEYLRDAAAMQRAKSRARFVTGRGRERIAEKNAAIVTTSGMLSGGPVATYVPAIRSDPTNMVALTGYQAEGTPGHELLHTGRAEFDGQVVPVSAQTERYEFSSHADRDGLLSLLDEYRESHILVNHGDRAEAFAADLDGRGFSVSAPTVGETVVV